MHFRPAIDRVFLLLVRNQAFWKSTENICQQFQAVAVHIFTTDDIPTLTSHSGFMVHSETHLVLYIVHLTQ